MVTPVNVPTSKPTVLSTQRTMATGPIALIRAHVWASGPGGSTYSEDESLENKRRIYGHLTTNHWPKNHLSRCGVSWPPLNPLSIQGIESSAASLLPVTGCARTSESLIYQFMTPDLAWMNSHPLSFWVQYSGKSDLSLQLAGQRPGFRPGCFVKDSRMGPASDRTPGSLQPRMPQRRCSPAFAANAASPSQ